MFPAPLSGQRDLGGPQRGRGQSLPPQHSAVEPLHQLAGRLVVMTLQYSPIRSYQREVVMSSSLAQAVPAAARQIESAFDRLSELERGERLRLADHRGRSSGDARSLRDADL